MVHILRTKSRIAQEKEKWANHQSPTVKVSYKINIRTSIQKGLISGGNGLIKLKNGLVRDVSYPLVLTGFLKFSNVAFIRLSYAE